MPFAGDPIDVAIKCANEFEEVIKHQGAETIAAMIAEPISAAYGIQVPPAEYWQRLREIADTYDIVLIADEVINGFWRTGKWFGIQNWDVIPDLMTVAKGITNGHVGYEGLVDMEAAIIIPTVINYLNIDKIAVIKVVSDHMDIADWFSLDIYKMIQSQLNSICTLMELYA